MMEVGDVWCSEEPLVYGLSSSQYGIRCDNCFLSPSTKLRKCSACGISSYCNRICQKSSWKLHKAECASFRKMSPEGPLETITLLCRILVLRKMGLLYKAKCTVFGKSRTFKDLVSNTATIMQNRRRQVEFHQIKCILQELSNDDDTFPDPTELMEICGKVVTNSFSICDAEMQPIGVGVYLRGSALDHSCQANAVAVFTGTTLIIRCIERVPHESQLRINYIDQLATTSERRCRFEAQYCFTCQCPLCLDTQLDAMKVSMSCPTNKCDGFILQNTEQEYTCDTCSTVIQWEEYTDLYSSAIRLAKDTAETAEKQQGSADDILKQCTECLGSISKILHPLNIYCVQLRDRLVDVCIDLECWSQALTYAQANTPPYRKYYTKHHPNLGIHLFKVGKLQSLLGQLRCAMASFQQAQDILHVTHGKDHSLCQDLHSRLTETAAEHAASFSPTLSDCMSK